MHQISAEVMEALRDGLGVVALESTLIAHGLPWPDNLDVARRCEQVVRDAGAVPATVAVLGGQIRVGLDAAELERLARPGAGVLKASRRDLAWAVARGLDAATTVSATLRVARGAGLGVMATGGLGGVHRGAGETFDVSTDLDELARADGVVVVCSGVKSILDVAATLEVLETRGVAVVGYRTDDFPRFTSVGGGDHPLDARVETPAEVAALVAAHRRLDLPGALVVAQPVPEGDALDHAAMERALDAALAEAKAQGVGGKAVTPFLLDRLRHATDGRSLRANRSLIVNNARLAGEVAAAIAAGSAGVSPRPGGRG